MAAGADEQEAIKRPARTGKGILPILGYYLTFIHYFGFSINPNDDAGKRYLSIRLKRVPAAARNGTSTDQWLASYKMRARNSLAGILTSVVRIGIKFTAISFTTFLTLNHCIVLVDYIYRGTKEFEELMFDVRLVITKFSALIFVLSWHCKQAQVRQLIKLVKSTSIYILGTGLPSAVLARDSGLPGDRSAPQSPQPASQWQLKRAASRDEMVHSDKPVRSTSSSSSPSSSSSSCLMNSNSNSNNNNYNSKQLPTSNAEGNIAHLGDENEIGDCNNLIHENITRRIDRRILRWWLMCVSVTALHFSLSEAELTKSHHLWQWLDDYSLHQLNNQTTSKSTLLFLASFDNYIYTVHVYGTRLIGASIICIVCSFQCENIASLRWHTLQLIRSSTATATTMTTAPTITTTTAPSSGLSQNWWLNYVAPRHNDTGQVNVADSVSTEPQHSETGPGKAVGLMSDRSWQWHHLFTMLRDIARIPANSWKPPREASCNSHVNVAQHTKQQQQQQYLPKSNALRAFEASLLKSCIADRHLFFVLGESDWTQVRENVARLSPRGYLSSSMWRAKRWLLARAAQLLGLIMAACMLVIRATIAKFASQFSKKARPSSPDQCEATQRDPSGSRATRPVERRLPKRAHNSASFSSSPYPLRADTLNENLGLKNNSNYLKSHTQRVTPISTGATSLHLASNESGTNVAGHAIIGRFGGLALTPKQSNAVICEAEPTPYRAGLRYAARSYRQIDSQHQSPGLNVAASDAIEWQMERLASKYELVRTVNGRIDSCFGPMLLIQFFFLFLMSCIDVVYFSICFNPNTKTKYIIISGMILLWWPYLLLYKFASDIGSNSKELLISVRRLARLSLIQHHLQSSRGQSRLPSLNRPKPMLSAMGYHLAPIGANIGHKPWRQEALLSEASLGWRLGPIQTPARSYLVATGAGRTRARIINKLDHVFKPTTLSILDILTVDKFFLLNFAKIVITASVMIIQFISK